MKLENGEVKSLAAISELKSLFCRLSIVEPVLHGQ